MAKLRNYNKTKKVKISNGVKIGLYIPCYNAERYIKDVLEGVFNQSLPPDEVIVVDDCSTDNTVEVVKRYPVKLIRHNQNRGLAACRNTAVKNMEVEFVASLDADCKPENTWLERLMGGLKSLEVAGGGGRLTETYIDTVCGLWRSVHMKQHWDEIKSEPPFLFGSNSVFRRKALLKVGLYNENFGNNYEDVDICSRLKKERYGLVYEPEAVCYHMKQDTLYSLLNDYWRWYLAYYQKESFYEDEKHFLFKLKDNIGLANRYMEEDIASGRKDLLYLDFLLGLHHCLKDLEYFCCRGTQVVVRDLRLSCWLSLIDLSLFYHLDTSKDRMPTLMPKEKALLQNLLALNLVLARLIQSKFKSSEFKKTLYRDLLISVYNIDDEYLSEKLSDMVNVHSNWDELLRKAQPNLSILFLKNLALIFHDWINHLGFHFPEIFDEINVAPEVYH